VKTRLGLDWWDVAIQAFVTICVAVAGSEAVPRQVEGVIVPAIFALSAVIFAGRRSVALRRLPDGGATTGEVQAVRAEELEQRLGEMDLLEARLAELENRVEFSERLLAQQREAPKPRLEAR
jgi:hypothetical protein